jgi:hypothetical protein
MVESARVFEAVKSSQLVRALLIGALVQIQHSLPGFDLSHNLAV